MAAWSLSLRAPSEPDLVDRYLLACGRALYLATAFESKCLYLTRMARLVEQLSITPDLDAALEVMRSLRNGTLGQAVRVLEPFVDSESEYRALDRARRARNYIAHEAAELGPLDSITADAVQSLVETLRGEVGYLIAGDDLISRWVYELDEKEPAPRGFSAAYPRMADDWVFSEWST